MPGRNLRLLVINDENKPVKSPLVDIVDCSDGAGGTANRLGNWLQHIYMWGIREIPEFDLLLIDIRFNQDMTDPKYESLYDSPAADAPNPLGLVHALPLVARQDLHSMPVVWGIHSGDPSKVKDDPIAIFAFALLLAMEGREGWDTFQKMSTRHATEVFSKMIDDMPKIAAPTEVWHKLIPEYRARLVQAVADGQVSVETDPIDRLLDALKSQKDFDEIATETLPIMAGYEKHELRIRSLLGDFDEWSPNAAGNELKTFLSNLRNVALLDEFMPRVKECLDKLDLDENEDKTVAKLLPADSPKLVGVGIIVCCWLRRFFHNLPRRPTDILADLHLGDNYWIGATRILVRGGFKNVALKTFLNRLDTEVLTPPILQSCAREYYVHVLSWTPDCGADWPFCLGPRPS